jgi:hypothetical protein
MAAEKVMSLPTPALSEDREAESEDDCVRIRFHQPPTRPSLRHTVLSWSHAVGVRPVLLEIRNCYHRIQLRRKIGHKLLFEEVRNSLPLLVSGGDSASRIGRHSYIEGIQALQKERPWITLLDAELYLQGWFQAEWCLSHSEDIPACTPDKETHSRQPPCGTMSNSETLQM